MDLIPECRCGRGKMILKCAGKEARHSGRYYYKCPENIKHDMYFLWCDEYHQSHPSGTIPTYVLNQAYTPKLASNSAQSSTSLATDMRRANVNTPMRLRNDIEVCIAFMFMSIVFTLFGVILGKLM